MHTREKSSQEEISLVSGSPRPNYGTYIDSILGKRRQSAVKVMGFIPNLDAIAHASDTEACAIPDSPKEEPPQTPFMQIFLPSKTPPPMSLTGEGDADAAAFSFQSSGGGLTSPAEFVHRSSLSEYGSDEPKRSMWQSVADYFRPGSIRGCIFNLCAATLGAGALSIPYAVRETGLVLGSVLLILGACATVFSIELLLLARKRTGRESYEDLSVFTFGKSMGVVVEINIIIFCFGAAVSYIVAVGDILSPLLALHVFPGWVDRTTLMTVFWALVMFPLSIVSKVNSLTWSSLVGVLSIFYLVFATTFSSLDTVIHHGWGDVILAKSDRNVLLSLPIIMFAYTCHVNVFSIQAELDQPTTKRMTTVVWWAIGISLIIYLFMGCFGYLDFLEATQGNILGNYAISVDTTRGLIISFAFLAISITVVMAFPLNIFPIRFTLEFMFCGEKAAKEEEEEDHDFDAMVKTTALSLTDASMSTTPSGLTSASTASTTPVMAGALPADGASSSPARPLPVTPSLLRPAAATAAGGDSPDPRDCDAVDDHHDPFRAQSKPRTQPAPLSHSSSSPQLRLPAMTRSTSAGAPTTASSSAAAAAPMSALTADLFEQHQQQLQSSSAVSVSSSTSSNSSSTRSGSGASSPSVRRSLFPVKPLVITPPTTAPAQTLIQRNINRSHAAAQNTAGLGNGKTNHNHNHNHSHNGGGTSHSGSLGQASNENVASLLSSFEQPLQLQVPYRSPHLEHGEGTGKSKRSPPQTENSRPRSLSRNSEPSSRCSSPASPISPLLLKSSMGTTDEAASSSFFQRLTLSLAICGAALIVAIYVPSINIVFQLMGGTSSAFVCFILPPALVIKLGIVRGLKKAAAWLLLICGCLAGVLSTGVTILNLFPLDETERTPNLN